MYASPILEVPGISPILTAILQNKAEVELKESCRNFNLNFHQKIDQRPSPDVVGAKKGFANFIHPILQRNGLK